MQMDIVSMIKWGPVNDVMKTESVPVFSISVASLNSDFALKVNME